MRPRVPLGLSLASLIIIAIVSYVFKEDFEDHSRQSALRVSRFVTHAVAPSLTRMIVGLNALSTDISAPDFYTRLEAFARQHGLEQVSLYQKASGQAGAVLLGTVAPRDNRIFIASRPSDTSRSKFRFSNEVPSADRAASLIRMDNRLYLDAHFPLKSQASARIALPLPDSFLPKLEQATGNRISFYSARLKYIAGVLEPNLDLPSEGSFTNQGIDGVEYINYLTSVNVEGSELAKVVISREKSLLTHKITNLILVVLALNVCVIAGMFIIQRRSAPPESLPASTILHPRD